MCAVDLDQLVEALLERLLIALVEGVEEAKVDLSVLLPLVEGGVELDQRLLGLGVLSVALVDLLPKVCLC